MKRGRFDMHTKLLSIPLIQHERVDRSNKLEEAAGKNAKRGINLDTGRQMGTVVEASSLKLMSH